MRYEETMSQQINDPLPPPPDTAKFAKRLAVDLGCFVLGIVGAVIALVVLGWIFAIVVFALAVALSRLLRKSLRADEG